MVVVGVVVWHVSCVSAYDGVFLGGFHAGDFVSVIWYDFVHDVDGNVGIGLCSGYDLSFVFLECNASVFVVDEEYVSVFE
jgi:hypothetical protein